MGRAAEVRYPVPHELQKGKGGRSISLRCCGMKRLLRRPLTVKEILYWADAYRELTGKWPTKASGRIPFAKLENWMSIDHALRRGFRNLAWQELFGPTVDRAPRRPQYPQAAISH